MIIHWIFHQSWVGVDDKRQNFRENLFFESIAAYIGCYGVTSNLNLNNKGLIHLPCPYLKYFFKYIIRHFEKFHMYLNVFFSPFHPSFILEMLHLSSLLRSPNSFENLYIFTSICFPYAIFQDVCFFRHLTVVWTPMLASPKVRGGGIFEIKTISAR